MALCLEPGKTCWLLVADTKEPRHLYDLGFGYSVLKARGYSDDDIHVYTSHSNAAPYLAEFAIKSHSPLQDLLGLTHLPERESAVVVVSGHGSPQGIGGIKPVPFTASIRTIPGLKAGIAVLGQCYAGVFNPIDAKTEPQLVEIGATCLDTSLSSEFKLTRNNQPLSWAANTFLVGFFDWILRPEDVDGDGKLTLADAYKYAGVAANRTANQAKAKCFVLAQRLTIELISDEDGSAPLESLERGAKLRSLEHYLSIIYQTQHPWLLNAYLATDLHFLQP